MLVDIFTGPNSELLSLILEVWEGTGILKLAANKTGVATKITKNKLNKKFPNNL
jgi:hypothetical protein